MMRCKSKLAAMALSATLMIHVGVASAADDMKKDTMGKDAAKSGMMKKDAMASDCPDGSAGMPKDAMKQDSMAHGAMAGDAMKKSAKDCTDAAMKKAPPGDADGASRSMRKLCSAIAGPRDAWTGRAKRRKHTPTEGQVKEEAPLRGRPLAGLLRFRGEST